MKINSDAGKFAPALFTKANEMINKCNSTRLQTFQKCRLAGSGVLKMRSSLIPQEDK